MIIDSTHFVMADYMVDLTRQQAYAAVQLCLQNAREYLKDAKMHYDNKRFQHIRIPLQFSLEESGKARAMIDQLQNGQQTIQMNRDMRKGHQIKVDYIRQFVKPSKQKEQEYNDVWSACPFLSPSAEPIFDGEAEEMRKMMQEQIASDTTKKFIELDKDIINSLTVDAHEKRLGTLVNFDDNTFDPILAGSMNEGHCLVLIDAINNMLDDFDSTFSKINP
ncbi:AbiV family abortive infection protein [Candidatus Nitrosotenuis uzonensis]|uniref:Uncharacterized protein n=1 Tax=Candidatus Nitrosotenuis uzonensis TaxID=1407055 RepID=V6AQW7_9ARCH|nr:AbiV family abortive infection protein [Candidatus Nitrosotenuis uzonensis]CDI04945.1 hypothetical protein NITUZ_140020 [Candidatus Nitrosotenuis uzonensis]